MLKTDILQVLFGRSDPEVSYGEREIVWRIVWMAVIAMTMAYVSYLFFASIIVAGVPDKKTITGVDIVSLGQHRISGVVVVPSECHGVSVLAEEKRTHHFLLMFKIWEEPSRDCEQEPVAQAFQTTVFAPSVGVTFEATLDGKPVPLDLVAYFKK